MREGELNITIHWHDDVAEIACSGRISPATQGWIREAIEICVAGDPQRLHVDCRGANFTDSGRIEDLIGMLGAGVRQNMEVALDVSPGVADLIHLDISGKVGDLIHLIPSPSGETEQTGEPAGGPASGS